MQPLCHVFDFEGMLINLVHTLSACAYYSADGQCGLTALPQADNPPDNPFCCLCLFSAEPGDYARHAAHHIITCLQVIVHG